LQNHNQFKILIKKQPFEHGCFFIYSNAVNKQIKRIFILLEQRFSNGALSLLRTSVPLLLQKAAWLCVIV